MCSLNFAKIPNNIHSLYCLPNIRPDNAEHSKPILTEKAVEFVDSTHCQRLRLVIDAHRGDENIVKIKIILGRNFKIQWTI